ncbi:MAG: prolipoprotein diacylglyceryl transferase [Polyangiales bacterium]
MTDRVGKALYGALFVALLPALLVLWARAASPAVPLPTPRSLVGGLALALAGLALIFGGWHALKVHGGGLPMNAFPPPRRVSRGVYRLFAHPIYVGFAGAVLGVSLAVGSPAGVWLVSPMTALASAALVYGYERHDLLRRFGALHTPWMALAPDEAAPPHEGERAFAWVCVLLPWGFVYEAIAYLGPPPDAVSTALPFERAWPVLPVTELAYASIYLVALLAPALLRTRAALRRLCVEGLASMALVFPLYLLLPFVAWPRPFTPTTALGHALAAERALDTAACALPSFHVVWALILAGALASRSSWWWLWGAAVSLSCLTTGMHTLADVAAGVAVFALVRRRHDVWERLRAASERAANGWREWRFGPVRFINHGLWAGAGTAVALWVIAALTGSGAVAATAGACSLVGAALWAQWIEGASGLSRPYGFWGGLLGATAGGVIAGLLFGADVWTTLAAACVSAPLVQSFGRVRCLVQGCCHGDAAPPAVGITYRHPRSRVARAPELFGRPVHPTPLYSIVWNVVVGAAVVRLASLHAEARVVAGVYLLLTGIGRFVEESYRGEPQTPVYARLRLYQWVSLAAAVAGAAVTAGRSAPMPTAVFDPWHLAVALAGGAVNTLALGMDFPESRRRFSRLA